MVACSNADISRWYCARLRSIRAATSRAFARTRSDLSELRPLKLTPTSFSMRRCTRLTMLASWSVLVSALYGRPSLSACPSISMRCIRSVCAVASSSANSVDTCASPAISLWIMLISLPWSPRSASVMNPRSIARSTSESRSSPPARKVAGSMLLALNRFLPAMSLVCTGAMPYWRRKVLKGVFFWSDSVGLIRPRRTWMLSLMLCWYCASFSSAICWSVASGF